MRRAEKGRGAAKAVRVEVVKRGRMEEGRRNCGIYCNLEVAA